MTIANSKTYEFTVDRLVKNAFHLASLMGPEQAAQGIQWDAQATMAREFLEMRVKALESEGKLVRAWGFYELTVTSGTKDYVLPDYILDVFEAAAYIDPSSLSETPIIQMDLQAWQRLGFRDVSGRPNLYYAHRKDGPVEVRFDLIPEETATVRFQVYELFSNATVGTATLELERHWALHLCYALATMLAESANLNRNKINGLAQTAAMELVKAKGASRPKTGNQSFIVHNSGVRVGRW